MSNIPNSRLVPHGPAGVREDAPDGRARHCCLPCRLRPEPVDGADRRASGACWPPAPAARRPLIRGRSAAQEVVLVNEVDPETLENIRQTLIAQCDQVEELDRRGVVKIWRDWNAAYPLEPTTHRAVLRDSIVARLHAVQRSLAGQHAVSAYEQQAPDNLFFLCVDALVGWR